MRAIAVSGRVHRDLSAVGKRAKKERCGNGKRRNPKTIPGPCVGTRPHGNEKLPPTRLIESALSRKRDW